MKKTAFMATLALAIAASSCGSLGTTGNTSTGSGSTLGNILGSVLSGNTASNAVNGLTDLIIGSVKLSQSDLYGTWNYSKPACAFTSESLLAKAGGSVAAQEVNQKLLPAYNNVGIKSGNTYFTFGEDGSFSGKINNIPLSGTYTFDPGSSSLKMKAMLLSMTGYVTRTTTGMSLTFESKKLLTALQTISSLTGNSTLQAVGDLSKNYEGVRVGFDMKK